MYMLEAGPDSDAIQQVLTAALQRMWRGEIDVKEGLRDARRQVEAKRVEVFKALRKK